MMMKKILILLSLLPFAVLAQWQRLSSSESPGINQLIQHQGEYFLATSGGIYKSADASNWQPAMNGLNHWWVRVIHSDGQNLYAGTERNTAYRSNDDGNSWTLYFTNTNSSPSNSC
jgi:hypothetical protein